MDEDAQHNVENLFGFKEGTSPHGVPLISTRLTTRDCRPLIDKITLRWNPGLANGFPMLVDFSSSDQCCSVFQGYCLLELHFHFAEGSVCKVIDQILGSFLWHGAVGISKAAKVAWDVVYLPKEERGSWPQESS